MSEKNFFGQNPLFKRAFSMVFVLFLVLGALAFMGCPMDDDDSDGGIGIDSRLEGIWEFVHSEYGYGDRYVIRGTSLAYSSHSGTGEDAVWTDTYAGTIVHAERYSKSAGVIIIEYTEGHKYRWSSYTQDAGGNWVSTPLDPQPAGNFYGIYYHSLKTRDDGKLEVAFANTSDQANNSGPTEAETLEAAIEKFTVENMNKFMSFDVGDPLSKVE
jgi:hypothetical protein